MEWIQRHKKLTSFFLFILVSWSLYTGYHKIYEWNASPAPYTIGIDPTWHPLSLHGLEHPMAAFASDLVLAIGKDQNIKINIVKSGHKCLFDMLDDGKVNGVLAPVTKTIQKYLYSEPFYRYGAVVIVKRDSGIHSLSDLEKRRVAVKRGSPILYRLALDPQVIVLLYDNPTKALDDLKKGEYDAVVMDQLLTFLYYGGTYKDGLVAATFPLTPESMRLVVLKDAGNQAFLDKFNAGLKNLKESGDYHQLLEEWELYDPET